MATHTNATESGSDETNTAPCDLDWLRTTKAPVATRTQVAQIFGVDERTVTVGINDGSIPVVRIGRRALIPTAPLRRLLGVED
jgi:hypothetical protein